MRTLIVVSLAALAACSPLTARPVLSAEALAAGRGQEAYDNYVAKIEAARIAAAAPSRS